MSYNAIRIFNGDTPVVLPILNKYCLQARHQTNKFTQIILLGGHKNQEETGSVGLCVCVLFLIEKLKQRGEWQDGGMGLRD